MTQQKTRDNRRSSRIRRVQPIGFRQAHDPKSSARKTVSANVSQGGMLLVTRQDEFPPVGTPVDLIPESESGAIWNLGPISSRIVYTRFSPETNLRFAGFEFREALSNDEARSLGLNSTEDNVADTFQNLKPLETDSAHRTQRPNLPPLDTIVEVRPDEDQACDELNDACNEFVEATCSFIRQWAQDKVLDTVIEREDLSRAKGVEGLRALKQELNSLIEDYPTLTDAQLNRNDLWAHRTDSPDHRMSMAAYYNENNDRPARWIVDELRKLMGFAGVLLIKHGFAELSKSSEWSPLSHEKALVAYRGKFAISDEMRQALLRATALSASLREQARIDIESGRAEARAKIRKLWDEA